MNQSFSFNTFSSYSPNRMRKDYSELYSGKLSKLSLASNVSNGHIIKNSNLHKLHARKLPGLQKINAQTAQQVIKTYILPLLTREKQSNLSRSRSTAFGRSQNAPKATKKLSDHLLALLNIANTTLKTLQNKLDQTKKDTKNLNLHLNEIKASHISNAIISKFINYELNETVKLINNKELSKSFINKHKTETQKKFSVSWKNKEKISLELFKKRFDNYGLEEQTKQFSHWYLTLNMKSVIVGERLKGSYEAYMMISSTFNLEQKLRDVNFKLQDFLENLIQKESSDVDIGTEIFPDILILIKNFSDSFNNRASILKELRRLKTVIISKINSIHEEINSNHKETQSLINLQSSFESKLLYFTEEYDRTRIKLSEIIKKDTSKSEKICKTCAIVYNDQNNFNWSCKTHNGMWSGSMYWCCGQTIKTSKGCIKQKHFTKNEDENNIQKTEPTKEEVLCNTCYKPDHITQQCPLDPNTNLQKKNKIDLRISPEKALEVYKLKNKPYKVTKKLSKVSNLKDSLTRSSVAKSFSQSPKKIIDFGTSSDNKSFESLNSLVDRFPSILSRKVSKKSVTPINPILIKSIDSKTPL